MKNHKQYIIKSLLFITLTSILCFLAQPTFCQKIKKPQEITFGIIADVHADMLPDAKNRVDAFITKANKLDADMIIQLGDFCRPRENEKSVIESWNSFSNPKYHVLGNHDMDFNIKDEVVEYWGMPSNYYSFEEGDFHFIVLDANFLHKNGEYIDYANANFYVEDKYRTYINPEQIEWLKQDLKETKKPTLVFSHQSLINTLWGVKNRVEVQEIFEDANRDAGFKKVIACFNGHDHIDFHREINGIHYFEINSVGYQWMGSDYAEENCFDSIENATFNHLEKIAVYKDPLFAFVTIKNSELTIEGVKSEWFCTSPTEKGVPENIYGCRLSPEISDYKILIK